ncbi:hypothetical protein CG419_03970 [Latilactobacillus curvatus]|uniref:Uncharacterized protein n=1 Tax=Latilactobacillus curvatus TaxID=28038 RepID=A0AAC9UNI4_LATCU|nr:hypothetical protein [Latilactobacillus curvatus]ASN59832.1 hypothetical protein CG419_03970 [Latilactobacillus curvatus]
MEVSIETEVSGEIDFKGMISRLKSIDGQEVSAGLFGGFAAKKAMWNEYGTANMPARPFLRNTLYEHEREWGVFIGPKITAVIDGGSFDIGPVLGPKMVSSIKSTIDAGGFAPLAPATIAKKGHSKPLIDTGDMYGSITWRKGGG